MNNKFFLPLNVLLIVAVITCTTNADTVTLTPGEINGGDTNTTMFDDGSIQLQAFIGNAPTSFNANAGRLGVDNNGTNNNAFNDPDTDATNDNDERLGLAFAATVGLSQISWDFSRADGFGGGVSISGFAADPMASFSGQAAMYTSTYDSMTGTLNFEVPSSAFVDNDGFLNLGNLTASAGQSLTLRVSDPDQNGAQLAITSISYSSIPEPMAATVLLPLLAFGGRRRR